VSREDSGKKKGTDMSARAAERTLTATRGLRAETAASKGSREGVS